MMELPAGKIAYGLHADRRRGGDVGLHIVDEQARWRFEAEPLDHIPVDSRIRLDHTDFGRDDDPVEQIEHVEATSHQWKLLRREVGEAIERRTSRLQFA